MQRGRQGRVTLQLIGQELGVSAKTVSNAFTRPDQLSAELRERVLATAERLGYPGPDPLAAGLRRGRVGALGVAYANPLSYAFDDPVSVALLGGITSVAERAETGLLLIPGSAAADRAAAAVQAAVVDGLIANSLAEDDPVLHAALGRGLPLVILDQPDAHHVRDRQGHRPPWIGIDDSAAATAAVDHLLELGHRRFGVVSFAMQRTTERGLVDVPAQEATRYAVTRRRLGAYRDAATRAGIDWSTVPVAAGNDSTVEEGAAAAAMVLAREPRPTALLCLSDRLAEGALRTAAALGLDVPGALSVMGFDDAEPAARLGLSTISQPHRHKGELAATALLDLLAGRRAEPTRMLTTRLVVRASTGPVVA
jgi:DNA-binding LacI/PurR family transcriptional regulator